MAISPRTISAGLAHLREADPVMGRVIREVGPFTLRPHRDRFGMLVRSIISQQISTSAARAIRARLEAAIAPAAISPESLGALSTRRLRSSGLSAQKAAYLRDLCAHMNDGRLDLSRIGRKRDEQVIDDLVRVHGIGRWTAQMFLIFALGRLDVFPHADLGVRTAIRNLYALADLPDRAAGEKIAQPWRPYASIASWYCWRSEDLRRAAAKAPAESATGPRGYPV